MMQRPLREFFGSQDFSCMTSKTIGANVSSGMFV